MLLLAWSLGILAVLAFAAGATIATRAAIASAATIRLVCRHLREVVAGREGIGLSFCS